MMISWPLVNTREHHEGPSRHHSQRPVVAARQHRLAGVREEIERPAAGARAQRTRFDHFVEATYQQVSRPPFFLIYAW
jgi:hypothetical protein